MGYGRGIFKRINGNPIEDLTDGEAFAAYHNGFIGLQVHRIRARAGPYQVRWRKLHIREL